MRTIVAESRRCGSDSEPGHAVLQAQGSGVHAGHRALELVRDEPEHLQVAAIDLLQVVQGLAEFVVAPQQLLVAVADRLAHLVDRVSQCVDLGQFGIDPQGLVEFAAGDPLGGLDDHGRLVR